MRIAAVLLAFAACTPMVAVQPSYFAASPAPAQAPPTPASIIADAVAPFGTAGKVIAVGLRIVDALQQAEAAAAAVENQPACVEVPPLVVQSSTPAPPRRVRFDEPR